MPRRGPGRRTRLRMKGRSAREIKPAGRIKVAVGMIVWNGAYVLREALASLYPFVGQIVIAEGPVAYFASKGAKQSTDGTVEILKSFPDPQGKITLLQGQWPEKDEMVNAYAARIAPGVTLTGPAPLSA